MQAVKQWFGYSYLHSDVPSLTGKTYFVTGASNGIGLSIARTLYSHGAKVIAQGAQKDHLDGALSYIKTGDLKYTDESYSSGFGLQRDKSAEGGHESGEVVGKLCEFKDLKAVAELAKEVAKEERIDGLFLIAGLGVNAFEATKEGYDSHLIANSVANIVFVSHLLPVLEKTSQLPSTDVRIVMMSSELHRTTFGGPSETFGGTRFADEDEFKQDIGPLNLYSRTKLAVILTVKYVVKHYLEPTSSKVLCFATHPGGIATGQTRQYNDAYGEKAGAVIEGVVRPLMAAPDSGALSALWAGLGPEARSDKFENGSYFAKSNADGGETNEAQDPELIENFWNQSVKIIEKVAGSDALGPFKAQQ
ncbi:hypothetical protein JCM10212_005918 [Sporobolomyces blumeae]